MWLFMNWRIVVITKQCKLEYKLNYLVIKSDTIKRIYLPEIAVIIIESTMVAITGVLLTEIIKLKINLIFCDEKHNPSSQLIGLYNSHDTSKKIKEQVTWACFTKESIWTKIVKDKIIKQAQLLKNQGLSEYKLLEEYISQVEFGDSTNREGHAAKVYFNALFGKDFSRRSDFPINAILNYGYSILLSAFNREIVANGYITQLGLKHSNQFNNFNFSCDLMEPFRILIDNFCLQNISKELKGELKHQVVDILNSYVKIDGKKQTVLNAISIYTKSVFKAINNNDVKLIKFYEL